MGRVVGGVRVVELVEGRAEWSNGAVEDEVEIRRE